MMAESMNIKQNEVWLVKFFPKIGDEISKIRPALVISDDKVGKLKLRTVVPITDWKDRYKLYPWMIYIDADSTNGLSKKSAIDCFQVKNLSVQRFDKRIGAITARLSKNIHETVLKTFNSQYCINFFHLE